MREKLKKREYMQSRESNYGAAWSEHGERRYRHRHIKKERRKRKKEVQVGEVLTRDTTDVVSSANKFRHPKQIDLDRSNIYSSLVLRFTNFIVIHFYMYRSIISKKNTVYVNSKHVTS